jgi:hypothetical protein
MYGCKCSHLARLLAMSFPLIPMWDLILREVIVYWRRLHVGFILY